MFSQKINPGWPAQILMEIFRSLRAKCMESLLSGKPYYITKFFHTFISRLMSHINLLTNWRHFKWFIILLILLLILTPFSFFMRIVWTFYWFQLWVWGFPLNLKTEVDAFIPTQWLLTKGDHTDEEANLGLFANQYMGVILRKQFRGRWFHKIVWLCIWVVVKIPYYATFNIVTILTQSSALNEFLTYKSVITYLVNWVRRWGVLLFILYPPQMLYIALRFTRYFAEYDYINRFSGTQAEVYLFDESIFKSFYITIVVPSITIARKVDPMTLVTPSATLEFWAIRSSLVLSTLLLCLIFAVYVYRVDLCILLLHFHS